MEAVGSGVGGVHRSVALAEPRIQPQDRRLGVWLSPTMGHVLAKPSGSAEDRQMSELVASRVRLQGHRAGWGMWGGTPRDQ